MLSRRARTLTVFAAVLTAATGLSACSSSGSSKSGSSAGAGSTSSSNSSSSSAKSTSLKLVAYSVPKPAYDALGTAFAKTPAGAGVSLAGAYGPSGTQEKNVAAGQKADYVAFSTGSDMNKLEQAGKVAADWDAGPTKGIVADSVVVIVVKKGNPLGIKGWADLIKPGVKIVTPDPASSGSAKWNILAAYQHVIQTGGTPAQAQAYLKSFFSHVVSRASSGAVATTQFTSGTGNVLISYESEAILARQKGLSLDYIVPDQDVLIETPAAVTKGAPKAASDFLSYVESSAGQAIFASHGFRPVDTSVKPTDVKGANDPSNPYPVVQKLFTVGSLGGWSKVNDEFFGDNGIVTKIEK
ncbi:substrate-binding domain-containing protein [uncultured Jatrophihabitans sp.]|uniref:substrate-binding domain-containing protein n=1 Tax=uncultured Jatrophihabitans sp. TaxID=1610747 RepID=UPI0035C98F39